MPPAAWSLTALQTALEAVAMIAFALSGVIAAGRKQLDAVGVCVVAALTAFGGGTLRDVLLDRRPFFWVAHADWLWILLAVSLAAMLFLRQRHLRLTERAILWPDAVGLGLFAASGTQIALDAQMPSLVAVVMGMMTSAFGGALRDIVCNEIPSAFSDHRPYALCAFAGGWVVVAAEELGAGDQAALGAGALCATSLRVLALALDWRLPAWRTGGGASG
jgi:uncharacterized membrane protein YeiH